MPHQILIQNAALAPIISQLKAAFETAKLQLQSFFPSQKFIEKACQDYAQLALRENPSIMMLTEKSLAFHRELADPKNLKEIILEQERKRLIQELPLLAGPNAKKAEACLQRFRLSRLKNHYPAGFFYEYLHQQKLLAPEPSKVVRPKKVVRFA